MFVSHPIFFRLILIFISVIIRILSFKINISWFFFLLLLVFLGGVIILIIYINTLIINEKFYFLKNNKVIFFSFIVLIFFILKKNTFLKINDSNFISIILYENINIYMLLFLILYLLLTLICVVKLIKFEYGPLIKRLF